MCLKDTLTLKLNGQVPLSDFAQAVGRFSAWVNALSSEISGNHIDWEIISAGKVEALQPL